MKTILKSVLAIAFLFVAFASANAQSFYHAVFTGEKSGEQYAIHVYGPVLSESSYNSTTARKMLDLFTRKLKSEERYSNVKSYDGKAIIIRENGNGKKFDDNLEANYYRDELWKKNNVNKSYPSMFGGATIIATKVEW